MSQVNENITDVDINVEMKEAYLQYSMSVIVGRAIPDVRDGLKPVHRRILFAMHELRNTHDKPFKKSARVVGDVVGKYHPHGENAVYDTLVRMAQDFSLRYPLVDGQGNFGSIDGDSAAAPRYTEVRMTVLAEQLLTDIDKQTIPFGLNYDDSIEIPEVLPARFPNLLVNGSSGIAVGMATNIPPHNMTEVVLACLELIKNPDLSIDQLMEFVPGPDFPTAGVIAGRSGILSAYKKGNGVIKIKAVAEIEETKSREQIIITELPYQVNKAKLIESIADLVRDKKIEGISDIRDESSREGMRVVILLKKNENSGVILNRLFKYTQMQVSFGIRLLALNARNQPTVFNLKTVLEAFLEHRKDVVTKRCIFELKKAEARVHILIGLKKALDNIDEIVATIRSCKESSEAQRALIEKFDFSEIQAKAILDMRLARLTGLERSKLQAELDEIMAQLTWLKDVLGDAQKVSDIVSEELTLVKDKYSNPRRTKITGDQSGIEDEDLIASEDMVVSITEAGYVKRIPVDQYKVQHRGGVGLKGGSRQEDVVSTLFTAETKTNLLVFTNKGKIFWSKVYKVPLGSRTSKGKAMANVVNIDGQEKVKAVLPVKEFNDDEFLVFITKNGIIKRCALSHFSKPRPSGIIALTTDLDDELLSVRITNGKNDIFVATKNGMSIRFSESNVRAMGRTARGVKAISLSKDDSVVALEIFQPNQSTNTVLIVTDGGYGKRTEIGEYRSQSRGGVGIITQKTTDKVGDVVHVKCVTDSNDVILTTTKGQSIRMKASEISTFGRNTQGVRLINVKEDEQVSSFAVVDNEESEDSKEQNKSKEEPKKLH